MCVPDAFDALALGANPEGANPSGIPGMLKKFEQPGIVQRVAIGFVQQEAVDPVALQRAPAVLQGAVGLGGREAGARCHAGRSPRQPLANGRHAAGNRARDVPGQVEDARTRR